MSNPTATINSAITRLVRREVDAQAKELRAEIQRLQRQLKAAARGRQAAGIGTKSSAAGWTPEAIRGLRGKLQITQADLAQLVGITPVAVYYWESGRTTPSGERLETLKELKGMSATAVAKRLKSKAASKKRKRK